MACYFLGKTANNTYSCGKKRQKSPNFTPTSGGIFNREWQHWCRYLLSMQTPADSSLHLRLSHIIGAQVTRSYLTPRLGTLARQPPRSVPSATLMEIARSVPASRDIFSSCHEVEIVLFMNQRCTYDKPSALP